LVQGPALTEGPLALFLISWLLDCWPSDMAPQCEEHIYATDHSSKDTRMKVEEGLSSPCAQSAGLSHHCAVHGDNDHRVVRGDLRRHSYHRAVFHGVRHAVQHRVVEKATLGVADHTVERVAERAADHLLQRGLEQGLQHGVSGASGILGRGLSQTFKRGAEATGERLCVHGLERGVEESGHFLESWFGSWLQRTTQNGGDRVLEKGRLITRRGFRKGSNQMFKGWGPFRRAVPVATTGLEATFHHCLASGLKMFRTLIPVAGTFFLVHLAHEGWHRAEVEWKQKRGTLSTWLFVATAMCDTFDTAVHACVVASYTVVHVDHHLIHKFENLALKLALLAMICMMLGELISSGALQSRLSQWCCRRSSACMHTKKPSLTIVSCVP